MNKIRKSAQGKQCEVRIPGVCNHNPETTVCAHIRQNGLCGVGVKPHDLMTVRACSACHDAIDGRIKTPFTRDEIRLMVHEAHLRTLQAYIDEGLVNCVN